MALNQYNGNQSINPISAGLQFEYIYNENNSLRLRFDYSRFKNNNYNETFSGPSLNNWTIKYSNNILIEESQLNISPGFIVHSKLDQLEINYGMELSLGISKGISYSKVNKETELPSNKIIMFENVHSTFPSAYSIGLGGIIGANWVPLSFLSIGLEFSPSLNYINCSGNESVTQETNGSNIFNGTFTFPYNRSLNYHYMQRFSFSIGYRF
jgi:hypothetical protein